ncbi:DUF4158 domain-containing protein [Nonomuraea sp. LP-02]|uniref:DUF4158 domain-containing protein n=1 Tax=Nonomuraea sp. LP-02 TaxID=3097960 RepID=UPI002E3542F7|nr:DUF4158 domain-containing protein [Nonomuraea sp. LP-02]MED7930465.1 DUF4158 domain-containing protein [Nonomuraea sp. LP-02]
MPDEVLVYLGEQLGIEDVPQISQYTERRSTPFEHQDVIRKAYALKEFSQVEADFIVWASARAWNTGDGKKTIFYDGVTWLRTNKVLLPGVTTLALLVARVRDEATDRLYDTLRGVLSPRQRFLEMLLEMPEGRRSSDLERWRKGPAAPSGRNLEKALELAAEILGVGLGAMPLPLEVPHRRMVGLARYGMQATATALRRHGPSRQLATLLATVIYLEGKAVDDCLEMLDLLVGGDHHAGQVQPGQQRRERGDLVTLSCDLALGHDGLGVMTGGGQQVDRGAVGGAAAAQGLAVHGQAGQRNPAWVRVAGGWRIGGENGQVAAGGGVEDVTVQAGEQASQGAGGQSTGGGQAGAGAQVGIVSVDEPGDRYQGCCSAEDGEQG